MQTIKTLSDPDPFNQTTAGDPDSDVNPDDDELDDEDLDDDDEADIEESDTMRRSQPDR